MVEPCDICGDVGVFEAIITCCECKASREHLYCMSVVRTEVPPFWTCQECEHKKLILLFSFEEHKPETSTKKVLSVPEKIARVLEGPKRPPLASRFHFKEKRVDTGRTQYLSCEDATKLSSGSNKPSKTPFRSVHGSPKSMPPPRERTPIKSPLRERTTQHERSKSLEPELKQSFCQQSASPNEKVVLPFTNKRDATPSIKSPERVRTPIVSPSCERATKFEPDLRQPIVQQSTGLKEKVVLPFTNKRDATPSVKSPESVRTPIVSPSRERAAKFEPHLRQPNVQQSTGLKEKIVWTFHNKGGAARSIKSPVRIRTLAELLQQERAIEVKPDSQQTVVQESTGPKGVATSSSKSPACERMPIHLLQKEPATELEPHSQQPLVQKLTGQKAEKAVLPSQNRGNDATPSFKPPMSSTTKRKFTEREITIARIEVVPPIKVANVGKEVVMAKSPKEPEKPETNTGGKNHGDVEARSSDTGKPNLTSGLPVSEMHSPYIPSCLCYWTGVLFLPDRPEKFNGAFRAHLPSKAHYKVYEMVKKMPENLYFQLVPRHEIWMGIFPDNSPDRDDIGLYFFPEFKKRSENDISIIDLLWKENLVMRSSVEGRELLVFSSRLLPSHSQEFQGSYFLWGVFCCPKFLKKVAAPQPLLERNCEPYDDVPPGFKRICKTRD